MGLNGQGVTVAVVDSGITNDPDFSVDPTQIDDSENSSRLLAQEIFTTDTLTRETTLVTELTWRVSLLGTGINPAAHLWVWRQWQT